MKARTAGPMVVLALGIFWSPLASDAQQPAKVPRIGFLSSSSLSASPHVVEPFRQGFRELGYLENQNLTIEYRWAEGGYDRLPVLAGELVRLKVDVIVTMGTPAALAAKTATRTIPIVMAVPGDPVGTGLVASLARPGGNITGLSFMTPEVSAKQLELLAEALPKVSRVAVLWNPGTAVHTLMLREIAGAAKLLGVQLQTLEARSPDEFGSAFAAMATERAGALLVLADAMFPVHRTWIAALAVESRLPAMYGLKEHVEAGGLMAYAPSHADLFRRAPTYVDKILKGAKPGDLPVEQPTKFELVINLKTAKALGLTIPPAVLARADEVIE